MGSSEAEHGGKAKRKRSPNHPGLDLREALDKAKTLHKKEGRSAAHVDVILEHWGYTPKTGPGMVALAALKQFSLVEDEGSGSTRRARLTDVGWSIINDPTSPRSQNLIRDLALRPPIYAELWRHFGGSLPSDATLKEHLVLDSGFTERGAAELIRNLKETVAFAGLRGTDKLDNSTNEDVSRGQEPKIGDYVQWESGGVLRFEKPEQIIGISPDGTYAFVESSSTGLPMNELIVQEKAPVTDVPPSSPPHNPLYRQLSSKATLQDVFSSSEGSVTVEWPASISPDFFQDVKDWLKILERKIGRSVKEEKAADIQSGT